MMHGRKYVCSVVVFANSLTEQNLTTDSARICPCCLFCTIHKLLLLLFLFLYVHNVEHNACQYLGLKINNIQDTDSY